MAITMTTERPAIESVGASGCSRGGASSPEDSSGSRFVHEKALRSGTRVMSWSLEYMQASVREDETAGVVELIHQI